MDISFVAGMVVGLLLGIIVAGLWHGRRRGGPRHLDEPFEEQLENRAPELRPDEAPEAATGVIPPAADERADAPQPEAAPADTTAPPERPPGVSPDAAEAPQAPPAEPVQTPTAPPLSPAERFRARLGRARNSLGVTVAGIFGRGVTDEAWEELEESLIAADVGVEATLEIVEEVRRRCRDEGVTSADGAMEVLKDVLRQALAVEDRSLHRRDEGTSVWLVTGVNGTGKTTSIGKIAARHVREGDKAVLAAADTFRAAAVEQLELWGERSGARVVKHGQNADPAAVAFDGYQAAVAAGAQLLLIDTAGRLQNKTALMAELSKVKRVLEREAGPCDEVLLVLDATTGQNGLSQARAFLDAVEVTGVVLTKLDGTAKGGIVVAIQRQLGLPVKLVGLGEDIDDLAEFDPDAFVEALFAQVSDGGS